MEQMDNGWTAQYDWGANDRVGEAIVRMVGRQERVAKRGDKKMGKRKYIIFDLEATCWNDGKDRPHEIIEIGAYALDDKLNLVSEYSHHIKPHIYPILSDFCKELTGIKQSDVERAYSFKEIINDFKYWIGIVGPFSKSDEYWLCSWGFYDRRQLIKDHALYELEDDWLDRHISIKHQYSRIKEVPIKKCGLHQTIERMGRKFEGRPHKALDDVRNINYIFTDIFPKLEFKMQGV